MIPASIMGKDHADDSRKNRRIEMMLDEYGMRHKRIMNIKHNN